MVSKYVLESHFGSFGNHRNGLSNARYIGYVVDALALAGDEGRGKLR
jgi:hypothetical protein